MKLGGTVSVEGGTRSVEGSKGKKYLGVRLKRSEIGHLYLEQADQYTQKRQQNIVMESTR